MFDRPFACRGSIVTLGVAVALTAVHWTASTQGEDKNTAIKETKVAGILMQKKNEWIAVKADGEEEPIKYPIGAVDNKVKKSMEHIFDAARVQLTYKQEGDARQLTSIKRQIFKENGTITGSVVKVYNDFWVEVKPKSGASDAYAPGANYNDKIFMEKLKGLKPGDVVTIKYYTDFERHRIETMTINKKADAASLNGTSLQSGTPPKK